MPPEAFETDGDHSERQTLADTALVVEALAAFAGNPATLETHRERRAWELISTLAADLDMTPSEVLRVDTSSQSSARDEQNCVS